MKIMCVGQSAFDVTLVVDHYPVENEKDKLEDKVECGGGSASNCAYLLAKWGLDTYFGGVIGNDFYGNKILDEYKSVGVNTKYTEVSNTFGTTTSFIFANKSNGTRTILTKRDKGIAMTPVDVEEQFDFLLFDGYEKDFCLDLIKKNPNAISIIDAGSFKESTYELAKAVDYVVCSHDFAEDVSHVKIDYNDFDTIVEAYQELKKTFTKNLIITLEEHGCFTCIDGLYKIIPSIKMHAVDTTGAGDIFHGAFVYSLANGFDLEKTLLFSNITGALSVTKVGGRNSIPELQDVESKYNDIISQ